MKRVGTFITGLLVGATLFGGTAAYAAGIMAEQSLNRIFVDGQEVQLTAHPFQPTGTHCFLRK